MHVCFVTGLYQRNDAVMVERQGQSLIEAGFKVTYVVCDDKPNEVKYGINILSTGFTPKGRVDRFLHTKSILKKYLDKNVDADIYQISDPELISLIMYLKKKGKWVIFNMREYYPEMIKHKYYIPKIFRLLCAIYYTNILKCYLKKYDAVFVVTNWILDILKKKWKINQTYLLTNFPIVNTSFSLSFEDYNRRGNVLCYEGTIYIASRQENVFNALEHLPNVKYLLAGVIDFNYDAIKLHTYWNKVDFIGEFNMVDLPMIFNKSTMSNCLRDFGDEDGSLGVLKIFESMEAALPVLFPDVPLYRDIVAKYHCGICVNPNDSKQIEAAISFLISNKIEAYEMGQRGRKAVIKEYNWENQFKNYLSVIRQIV